MGGPNRQKKQDRATKRVVREKFMEERKVKPLQAKNDRQKRGLQYLEEKQLVVLSGAAGSGKTEIACWYASKQWLNYAVDNIIITRPNKSMDGDDAPIPGNDFEKILPYTMSMLTKFKKYLGPGILKNNLRQDMQDTLFKDVSGIQVYSLEKLQGMSFDSSTVIICDEAQSATVSQIKSLLTRAEKGCKLIICGDVLQSAIRGDNGLSFLLDILEKSPHEDIGVVRFLADDCCREGISAHFTEIFEKEGNWKKDT